MTVCKRLFALLLSTVLVSCAVKPDSRDPVQPSRFDFDDLAKADVDMVAEINVRHSLAYLNELARKLYVRNPRQLARAGYSTRDDALRDLAQGDLRRFNEALQGRRSIEALMAAFSDQYAGDRVAAFIIGMRTMLLDSYGGKTEFYMHHSLDPQKLHYLARNFEIAFWKLGHDRGADGELMLLSNSLQGSGDLSFERIAGKLIGLQDHMAQVIADSSNRQIKNVVQGVASAVFFPI